MNRLTGSVLALVLTAAAAVAAAAPQAATLTDDQRDLRTRVEARYEVVPFSDGLALRPKSRAREVRLIEVTGGAITIDGVSVTGRELRDRVGADADLILRLSYLDEATRKALFSAPGEPATRAEETPSTPAPEPPEAPRPPRARTGHGDRVRILGSVTVASDELVDGQAVAVIGSVRVDGEVGQQVVAVLGNVDLGPNAIVGGDVVSVGGRVRRAAGAQVHGGITEVALGRGVNVEGGPHIGLTALPFFFGPFGAVARLIGTLLHVFILALLASLALLIARITVENSAERVAQEPLKSMLVGVVAQILCIPVFVLVAIVLAITIIGIPLLLLLPFAALFLVLLALVGFSGTALTLGRMVRARFGGSADGPFFSLLVGVVVILLPILVGRLVGLLGWSVSPLSFLFIAAGLGLEYLAWASGFGAVLTNVFTRWQARRSSPGSPPAPESATV